VISIVTPAFNEAANLENLYARIADTTGRMGDPWEWVVVDDHSQDETFAVLRRLSASDGRVRGIRLARNSGSHVAIAT
jgi:glycosyltransferase involved in cell wall biosynthesis